MTKGTRGVITEYRNGRGVATFDGARITFMWHEVEPPPHDHPSWSTNGPHGNGYVPQVGAVVEWTGVGSSLMRIVP